LTIETNGTLITEEIASHLREKSTLSAISVSLDGATPQTHDPFRGVKGSFDKAVQGIRYLAQAGYRPQIIMSIHAGNEEEIEDLVHLAENLGASSVKFNIIQPSGRGQTMTERYQVLNIERLLEIGKWIDQDLSKRTSIGLHYSWPMAFYSIERLLNFEGYSCNLTTILGILPTGHLALCGIGMQIPELLYGKLGEDQVAEIWKHHSMLAQIRQDIPERLEGICSECIFLHRCKGTCVAENYSYYGKLTSPFWFCQVVADKGLFPISRKQ
jgi:SynChlorMet cassette radical SAM/SPASM protein ScmF